MGSGRSGKEWLLQESSERELRNQSFVSLAKRLQEPLLLEANSELNNLTVCSSYVVGSFANQYLVGSAKCRCSQ